MQGRSKLQSRRIQRPQFAAIFQLRLVNCSTNMQWGIFLVAQYYAYYNYATSFPLFPFPSCSLFLLSPLLSLAVFVRAAYRCLLIGFRINFANLLPPSVHKCCPSTPPFTSLGHASAMQLIISNILGYICFDFNSS